MIHQYLRTWFFSFLFSSLVLAEWNPKDFLKREHSLIKPFTGKHLLTTNFNEIWCPNVFCQGSGFGIPNWDFIGSTMVTSNYIRLTTDEKSKQGAIWNKVNFITQMPYPESQCFLHPLGSVSDEKLGVPVVFQSLRHHERPFRRRVCILVSVFVFVFDHFIFICSLFFKWQVCQGQDVSGHRVWITGHVEWTCRHRWYFPVNNLVIASIFIQYLYH